MYRILPTPEPVASFMPIWALSVEPYTEVIGYSYFGLIFLREPTTSKIGILQPLRGGLSRLGPYPCVESFRTELLEAPGVINDFLRPHDLKVLAEQVGELADNEIYIPVPYPFIGGSGDLSTYETGDVRVFLDIVGQWWGIPASDT
jgi:hypothetical protein